MEKMKECNVALVDDHPLVREGIAKMIESLDGYTVSIQANNGKEFLQKLEHLQSPQIAVIDMHMPIMDGFETIKQMNERKSEILPLALTFDDSDDTLIRSIRAGARGFLPKDSEIEDLKRALDSILLTGYYHTAENHAIMMSEDGLTTNSERQRKGLIERISQRELEFLNHVCSIEEPTYEKIAELMGVHRRTVDNYRISLFEKFSIKSKAGLVLFAMRWGVVSFD